MNNYVYMPDECPDKDCHNPFCEWHKGKPEGICVLVDGGCLNNNKPVSERSMYGSMTVFHNGKQVDSTIEVRDENDRMISICHHTHTMSIVDAYDHASNNMAEVVMLRTALEYVYQLQIRANRDLTVTVMSDSEWALGVVTGVYKIKAQNETAYHNELTTIKHLKGQLEKLGCTLIFQHVNNLWVKSVLGH